jgi:UMF1 family MFS transporter
VGPVSGPDDAVGYPADRKRQQRAWYFYDWANSGYWTTTATVLISPYLISVAKRAACPDLADGQVCRQTLSLLGLPVAPGAIAGYVVAFATILSALILPIVGAIADRHPSPKTLMAGFSWVGSVAATCMYFIAGTNWQLGVVLLIVANMCVICAQAVYDSILCQIATPAERDRVSSRGWAMGYLGGFLLLAVNLAVITLAEAGKLGFDQTMAVRLSLASAGLWWGLFTIIPYVGLRSRHVPPGAAPGSVGTGVGASFAQLVQTLRHLRGYRQTWMFLLAYLFFNDGIQTVITSSSTYGAEELGFSSGQLVQTILLVQIVGFGGALLFGRLAARFDAPGALWIVIIHCYAA